MKYALPRSIQEREILKSLITEALHDLRTNAPGKHDSRVKMYMTIECLESMLEVLD